MNELYDVLKTSKASDFLIREEQTESREAEARHEPREKSNSYVSDRLCRQ